LNDDELNEPASPVCYAGEFGGRGRYMKAIVTVGLKPGVLDVQGKAVAGALKELGFGGVHDARVGKVIEIQLDGDLDPATAEAQVKEMCEKLLANTVIESYRVEIAR
jgi:phosphoribosylformylglycinamidine synthase